MSKLALALAVPPDILDAIAERVVDEIERRGYLTTAEPSPFANVEEAAAFLRCDRQRIYDLLSSERLTRYKDGSRVLIRRSELEVLVQAAPAQVPPSSGNGSSGRGAT